MVNKGGRGGYSKPSIFGTTKEGNFYGPEDSLVTGGLNNGRRQKNLMLGKETFEKIKEENEYVKQVKEYAKLENARVVSLCAKVEEELSELEKAKRRIAQLERQNKELKDSYEILKKAEARERW